MTRLVHTVLCILAVAELCYLLAANTVLATGIVQRFVNATEDAHLVFGRSYTLAPGFVHVEDLTLRFEDHNIQFQLEIDAADVKLQLLQLLRQRFAASRVQAQGVAFIFRHKLERVTGNERALELYPRITGFEDPPLLEAPKPSNPDDLWTFALDNVDAKLRELWFMTYRFVGSGQATGGFELVPLRKLSVGPAQLELEHGTLHLGSDHVLSKTLSGEISVRFAAANPNELPGLEIFKPISATIDLDLAPADLQAVNLYLPQAMRMTGGRGNLRVHLLLERGELAPGTLVEYTGADALRVSFDRFQAVAVARVSLAVEPEASGVKLDVVTSNTEIFANSGKAQVEGALARAERLQWVLFTTNRRIEGPLELGAGRLDAPGIRLGHLERLNTLLGAGAPVEIRGGNATVAALLEQPAPGERTGFLRGEFRDLDLVSGSHAARATGTVSTRIAFSAQSLEEGELNQGELRLSHATLITDEDATQDWWANMHVHQGHFRLGSSPELKATVTTTAKDAHPILDMVSIPQIAALFVPKRSLEASVKLDRTASALKLSLLARTGSLRARGRLSKSGTAKPQAVFLIQGVPAPLGFLLEQGDTSLKLLATEDWYQRQVSELPKFDGVDSPK